MKTLLLLFSTLVLFLSCKKDTNTAPTNKKTQNFYISFKLADSIYEYKVGDKYTYGNELVVSSSFGYPVYMDYSERTFILPLPYNANKMLVGFSFEKTLTECAFPCTRTQQKADVGREIFQKGEKILGSTGYNSDMPQVYEIYYPGGVAVYLLDSNGKYLASTSAVQPTGSYFTIDSVVEESYDLVGMWYAYEKIITGRFRCRVFRPSDNTYYKDIEGQYRMPVWLK